MAEKRKKRKENPVVEWISDNLRYILLIGGIALAAVIVVFIVKSFSTADVSKSSSSDAQSQSGAISDSVGASQDTAALQSSDLSGKEDAQSPEDNSYINTEYSLTDAPKEVVDVVTTYLNALADADADTASSVTESISDEDRLSIADHEFANSYDNIEVYTYPGEEDGSYVAFVRYEYTYDGYSTALPALTQFYIITRQDKSLCIASEQTQQTKTDYMNNLLLNTDVTELLSEVQNSYDTALASDPGLTEYINSIS